MDGTKQWEHVSVGLDRCAKRYSEARPVLTQTARITTCSSTLWPLDWTSTVFVGPPSRPSARRKDTMSALSMTYGMPQRG
eukprot:scaffold133722_cov26-Tisochrysis_lutea.AAC.4